VRRWDSDDHAHPDPWLHHAPCIETCRPGAGIHIPAYRSGLACRTRPGYFFIRCIAHHSALRSRVSQGISRFEDNCFTSLDLNTRLPPAGIRVPPPQHVVHPSRIRQTGAGLKLVHARDLARHQATTLFAFAFHLFGTRRERSSFEKDDLGDRSYLLWTSLATRGVPVEADVALPESSGPATILEAMRQR
jgi:hypothetical protein